MNIQTAIEEARKTNMALKKKWWPKGYFIFESGAFLVGMRKKEPYRFDVESLMSDDWIVADENRPTTGG